jgi:hypothetical protein
MSPERIERELRAANPFAQPSLEALDLAAGEAALGRSIVAESALAGETAARPRPRPRRSAMVLAAGALAAAAVAAVVLLVAGGGSESQPAYGAELVRFAESTPLLLLEGPDWRVQNVYEAGHGPYLPRGSAGAGSMEFVTGRPVQYESIRILPDGTERGQAPASVRQRKVELSWHTGNLGFGGIAVPHPIKLPVLGTTALVNTHAGRIVVQDRAGRHVIEPGGPGDRQMAAIWQEGGYTLELRAAVPDLAAFEERLGWLTRVDLQTWLEAMPASVVKAAEHDAAVHEMLKGIPLPDGFKLSQIPDEGITTSRSQLGGTVTGIVACLWFRQWGEARRSGDNGSKVEAERAMAGFRRWPILHQLARQEGSYPETLVKLVASMPSGVWQFGPHRWRLLPKAEGLGCARWGVPVLPWKQRLQRERRERQGAS